MYSVFLYIIMYMYNTCILVHTYIVLIEYSQVFKYRYYVCEHVYHRFFSSVRAVLQGACHMVAMQIACEPLVRQALRQVYQSRAVLNVRPTKSGKKVWEYSTQYYMYNVIYIHHLYLI